MYVGVQVGVAVRVDVPVGVADGVIVWVNVPVGVAVAEGVGVVVEVAVYVYVYVGVADGVCVYVAVAVRVAVKVYVGVMVGVMVGVRVGVYVGGLLLQTKSAGTSATTRGNPAAVAVMVFTCGFSLLTVTRPQPLASAVPVRLFRKYAPCLCKVVSTNIAVVFTPRVITLAEAVTFP